MNIRRLIAEIEASLNYTVTRVTLKEALEGKLPLIVERREPLYLAYADILDLSKIVPKEMWQKVYLPIVLIRRIDLGPGVFLVNDIDKPLIRYILGEEKTMLSKPEVQEIASKFPSLIHIMILGSDVE